MKKLPHKRIIIVFRLDLKIFMSENPPAETLDQLYIDTKLGHTYHPVSLSDLINRPYLDVVDFVLGEFKACKIDMRPRRRLRYMADATPLRMTAARKPGKSSILERVDLCERLFSESR